MSWKSFTKSVSKATDTVVKETTKAADTVVKETTKVALSGSWNDVWGKAA